MRAVRGSPRIRWGWFTRPVLLEGQVSPVDRLEYYEFQVSGPAEVNVVLFGAEADVALGLYDTDGSDCSNFRIKVGSAVESIRQTLSTGSYYLMVINSSDVVTGYQLAVTSSGDNQSGSGDRRTGSGRGLVRSRHRLGHVERQRDLLGSCRRVRPGGRLSHDRRAVSKRNAATRSTDRQRRFARLHNRRTHCADTAAIRGRRLNRCSWL